MTRKEVKEFLPILTAYAEGKEIQVLAYGDVWVKIENPKFNAEPSRYRIKPQSKYRPFKDNNECWDEMLKHQPFGWVENKEYNHKSFIDDLDSIDFDCDFQDYTFVDGTPFGKLEEEEQ